MTHPTPSVKSSRLSDFIVKDKNLFRLLIMLASDFILMSVLKPGLFLQSGNFISMAKQFPEFGILAIAIRLTMITGGIDLSVVAIASLSAILAAKFLIAQVPPDSSDPFTLQMIVIAVVIASVTGLVAGAVNGLLIAKIGIPAILATLGIYQLFSGIGIVVTEGRSSAGCRCCSRKSGTRSFSDSFRCLF